VIIEWPRAATEDDAPVERILIFAANPEDQPELNLDLEVRKIQNALRRSSRKFDVRAVWANNGEDLRRALFEYKPTFVHFCGHGAGLTGLALEGQFVQAGALAELFGFFKKTIRCVVLNACYSEIQAQAIVRHIDVVVGMNKAIGDNAAIQFAAAFYEALAEGEDVEVAFAFGRNAVGLSDQADQHQIPELLIRDPNGPPKRLSYRGRDWDGAPTISLLYGREAVAEMLRSWILEDFCRVVLITGMGGMGKTNLATCLGRGGNRTPGTSPTLATGIEGHFEAVLWRSLLNAPPPEELFADIIGVLADPSRPLPVSATERLEEVVRWLQQRRCLVILDNIETVLRPGDPNMNYREGFELYGTFLQKVGETMHQSCLLLTSREKPATIATLEGDQNPVRSLPLEGLRSEFSRDIFSRVSTFSGTDRDWERIALLYAGNPLALDLAARHINDVYQGDIAAFLESGQPLIRDLRGLLAWHIHRLSDAELEIVDWLAIDREPVSIANLQADVLTRTSRENVESTLQLLQRRYPIEHTRRNLFTLQPVLIEDATKRIVDRTIQSLHAAIAQAVRSYPDGGPSNDMLAAIRLLNSHALVKSTSKLHIRETQQLLFLQEIADDLAGQWSAAELREAFDHMLDVWRADSGSRQGYAAGNVINLMAQLGLRFDFLDVSRLPVWQACLDAVSLRSADFSFAEFRQTAFRHALGTVFSIAYTPDGSLIAAGDDSGAVRLFESATGQYRRSITGHADTISSIAFDADGRIMATGCYDNTVFVWDVASGRRTHELLGHGGWVYSVTMTPDGRLLASASEDGTVRLWDLHTGSWRRLPTGDATFMATVAFSPDGKLLAAGGGGGTVFLYSMEDPDHPAELRRHRGGVRSIAFARQGDLMATGGEDGHVNLWHPDSGEHLATLQGHSSNVMSVSFTAAGDLLASASVDHTIRLWSTGRRECVAQLQGSASRVWAVACSPTARTLAAASEEGVIRVWDVDRHIRLTSLHGFSNKTWGLAFSGARFRLLAANEDGVVRLWDVRDARLVRELRGHETRLWAVAASADGRWAASASDDGTVRLWDLDSGQCAHVVYGHNGWIRAVAFDSESRRLASVAEDGSLIISNVTTGARIALVDSRITRLFATTFCGRDFIAVAGSDPVIRLFSAVDGRHVGDLRGHSGWINALFVADRNTLVSCSSDKTMKQWDLSTWECMATYDVTQKVETGASWPEGRALLSGSEDGVLRYWNVATGQCDAEVKAHQGPVWGMSVDVNDATVATTGDDGVIRLWHLPDLLPFAGTNALRAPRPYEGMNISKARGLSADQQEAIMALGAIVMPSY
jgi:WD40 repeat protein